VRIVTSAAKAYAAGREGTIVADASGRRRLALLLRRCNNPHTEHFPEKRVPVFRKKM
jgi:hypothetical protein